MNGAAPSNIDRRRATAVFVDIVGATTLADRAGIEPAYAIVTGCLRVLDAIARRHGGVVDKYLSDCLMAVFGLASAPEDAAVSAVAAGVEMLEAAAAYAVEVASPLPLELRIGINTGWVIADDLRGRVVREFAVMGDAVNIAARLKDVGAPGAIHVGPETYAAAAGRFAFEPLGPLALRGKSQQVPAYRVIPAPPGGRRARVASAVVETPLAGRDAEMAALRAALAEACRGTSRAVVVSGDDGVGKSRLVSEVCREAKAAGATMLVGHGAASGPTRPLHIVMDLLSDWAGIAPAEEPVAAVRKLAEAAAAVPGVDPRRVAALHGAGPERVRKMGDVLADVVAALARDAPPVVLMIEDAHWTDEASQAVLAGVARATADRPVLWLVTSRETGDRLGLGDALGVPVVPLALSPLAPDDAARLLDWVLDGRPLSPKARSRLEARAAGNPYRVVLGGLLAGAIETEVASEEATGERASDAERRRVTVLFADISGFTRMTEQLPPAQAYAAVSGCLAILHEAATKHGGSVDKYLGDCIMAVFGAPIAIEDAPRAAVNAAIEMRRRVREYNVTAALPSPLDIHVGINTGLGVAGEVSGPLLREFTLMGEAVSLASKLKDVAPAGQIWVGGETQRATRGHFEFEPASSADPIRAWALTSEREQVYRARVGRGQTIFEHLVGRDAELSALRGAVRGLESGRGGLATIVGDPGLGKSRLLAELAASPEARAVRWAEGRSIAMGRTLQFHPFVDLVNGLFELGEPGPDTFGSLVAAAEPLLGSAVEELAPPLAMLLGAPLPAEAAAQMSGVRPDIVDRLQLHAVRQLLEALARARPLVLVFEDVHWADRASIDLLSNLFRAALESPLLFVLASRPNHPETTGRLLEAARATLPPERCTHVALAPLGPDETVKLLATLFPPGTLPRASRDRLSLHAGGNPLYLEELLRSFIEQGVVEVSGGTLRATAAIESITVPTTVQEVILNRVDRLRPRPKQTLQLAAVVGRRVAAPVIAELVADASTLPHVLDELIEAQLLVRDDRAGMPLYGFKHRLIQDVTYQSILETRRAELHLRVGHLIEERMAGTPGYHGMLAYHYSMGNALDRAEEQLFLAGDDAARAGAPTEALELLQESSRLYLARHPGGGDPAKRAALHKRLAGAYLHRGQMDDAIKSYDEALASLGETTPRSAAGVVASLIGTLTLVGLDLYLRDGGRASRPAAGPRDLEIIDLMFNRARAQTTADPARFLLNGLETLRKLRGIDPATVPGAGAMYAGTVGLFSYGGLSSDVGRRFLAVAARYVDRAHVPDAFFWRVMSFTHHFVSGDWDERHVIPFPDVEEALRHGLLWDVATYVGLEAFMRVARGQWAMAERLEAWLGTMEEAYAYDLASSNRHGTLAFLYTERRALDAAVAAADVYFTAHDEPSLKILGLATKAKAQALAGDLAAARGSLAATAPYLRQRVPPWHVGVVARSGLLVDICELEAGAGSGPRALWQTRRVRRDALWAAARFAWLRPEVWQLVARVHGLAGRTQAAVGWFGRALDESRRLGLAPETARIQYEIARWLLDRAPHRTFRGESARDLLFAARRELEDLELRWDLIRVDLLLSRLDAHAA